MSGSADLRKGNSVKKRLSDGTLRHIHIQPKSQNSLNFRLIVKSKKISNDQELIQSEPTSCPQNQKGNN